jgi:thiamine-phosphate diphosphorylase
LITDARYGDERIVECIRAAASRLPRGALAVQLRDKTRLRPSLRAFGWQLRAVTRRLGVRLLINGDARLARDVGADGVHLGHGAGAVADARVAFGRRGWVTVAAHTDDDVAAARRQGADAVLVSPVFATTSGRADGAPKVARGLGCLRAARREAGAMAVYALGGVTRENAAGCAAAGADGAAIIRGLLESDDPGRQARAIHDAWAGRW